MAAKCGVLEVRVINYLSLIPPSDRERAFSNSAFYWFQESTSFAGMVAIPNFRKIRGKVNIFFVNIIIQLSLKI